MRILLTFLLIAQKIYWDHDPGVVAPHLNEKTAAEYTEEARLARLEGSVGITLMVDADATLREIHVSRSLGLGLDQKAVEAVREWHFAPGTKDGAPVPVLMHVDVGFRMLGARNDWHLDRASFETARGASEPVVLEAEFPASANAPATVVVSFTVDAQGNPSDIHVETSSDAHWESAVAEAMAKWKFQPSLQAGKPIPVHATFRFVAGAPSPSARYEPRATATGSPQTGSPLPVKQSAN